MNIMEGISVELKAIPGKGAEGMVNNKNVKVVSPGFLREKNIKPNELSTAQIAALNMQGKTVIYFCLSNDLDVNVFKN